MLNHVSLLVPPSDAFYFEDRHLFEIFLKEIVATNNSGGVSVDSVDR